jgi:uncharacterized membrane protein
MTVSKKLYSKRQLAWKYSFAAILVIAGILLNIFNLGKDFFAYESVGNYLITIGFLVFAISTIFYMTKRKRIVDERMEKIGYKASRITFSLIFVFAFVIMILDGIKTINLSYQIFMSYFICGLLIVYIIIYKLIERKN